MQQQGKVGIQFTSEGLPELLASISNLHAKLQDLGVSSGSAGGISPVTGLPANTSSPAAGAQSGTSTAFERLPWWQQSPGLFGNPSLQSGNPYGPYGALNTGQSSMPGAPYGYMPSGYGGAQPPSGGQALSIQANTVTITAPVININGGGGGGSVGGAGSGTGTGGSGQGGGAPGTAAPSTDGQRGGMSYALNALWQAGVLHQILGVVQTAASLAAQQTIIGINTPPSPVGVLAAKQEQSVASSLAGLEGGSSAIAGALIGGMMFKFPGALIGGGIGGLLGGTHAGLESNLMNIDVQRRMVTGQLAEAATTAAYQHGRLLDDSFRSIDPKSLEGGTDRERQERLGIYGVAAAAAGVGPGLLTNAAVGGKGRIFKGDIASIYSSTVTDLNPEGQPAIAASMASNIASANYNLFPELSSEGGDPWIGQWGSVRKDYGPDVHPKSVIEILKYAALDAVGLLPHRVRATSKQFTQPGLTTGERSAAAYLAMQNGLAPEKTAELVGHDAYMPAFQQSVLLKQMGIQTSGYQAQSQAVISAMQSTYTAGGTNQQMMDMAAQVMAPLQGALANASKGLAMAADALQKLPNSSLAQKNYSENLNTYNTAYQAVQQGGDAIVGLPFSVSSQEKVSDAQFRMGVIGTVPGAGGNMRAATQDYLSGLRDEAAEMQRRLRSPNVSDTGRLEARNRLREIGIQETAGYSQLSHGWESMLASSVSSAPGNFAMIASRFTAGDAVRAGVRNEHFGILPEDIQSILKSGMLPPDLMGSVGTPSGFRATALAGGRINNTFGLPAAITGPGSYGMEMAPPMGVGGSAAAPVVNVQIYIDGKKISPDRVSVQKQGGQGARSGYEDLHARALRGNTQQ